MNHNDENDNLDDRLIKSGDYLMKRAVQYREQPAVVVPMRRSTSPRMRRVLVGTAAAATLTVTAVAGSFIGGTSPKLHGALCLRHRQRNRSTR
jgi:hypothetical protein